MRALAFALVTIAACGGSASPDAGDAAAVDAATGIDGADDLWGCGLPCPPCAADEACAGEGQDIYEYFQRGCYRTCATVADCPSGFTCFVRLGVPSPALCVSDQTPSRSCEPQVICDVAPGRCLDGGVLQTPHVVDRQGLCGWELDVCANGCLYSSDGGYPIAHCQ